MQLRSSVRTVSAPPCGHKDDGRMRLRRPRKAFAAKRAAHLSSPFCSRKAFSIGSIPSILLFLASIILAAILILLGMGFTKGGVEASIPNMEEFTSNYVLDTMFGLADWDGECGCLAKGTMITGKQVVYPGLVPVEKLDSMQDKCFNRVRKGSVIMSQSEILGSGNVEEINGVALKKSDGTSFVIPLQSLPIPNTTNPMPPTVPKQYITYEFKGEDTTRALLATAEPPEKTYLKKGDTIKFSGLGFTHTIDYVISPPVCIASIGTTETYLDPYWKPWKLEVQDVENGKKWDFGVTDCPLLRYCKKKLIPDKSTAINPVYEIKCDPNFVRPIIYTPYWEDPATRIVSIDYGGIVHAGKAKIQIATCKIGTEHQEVA